MRSEFIICKTRKTAINRAPWASIIIKVDGGYLAFESITDYAVWKNQK